MLEVVRPGERRTAKMNSSTAYRGCMVYLAGFDTSGYEVVQLPYGTTLGLKAIYPVNKYYFAEDLSDTSDAVDLIKKGDLCVYYNGGEYITDRFVASSVGLTSGAWASIEGGLSSSYGKKMYGDGTSTSLSTWGTTIQPLYVSSGTGTIVQHGGKTRLGYLCGAKPGSSRTLSMVGYAMAITYADSANARLQFRIDPAYRSGFAY